MASKKLTPEQAIKQKEALKKFHADKNKPTSAGAPRESKLINDVRRKFTELTDPSMDIISKAVRGDLTPEKSIWKGTPEDRQKVLDTNPSASFEFITLDNGLQAEVLIEYVSVSPKRVEIAKWVLATEVALKKAAEDSKLKKLEIAMKNKKAQEEGAIPKVDAQALAKEFGGPRLITEYDPSLDEDDSEDE
jgi:hypothetical protein